MKTTYFVLCFLFITPSIFAQNLVPNASFEQTHNLPDQPVSGNLIFRDHLNNWLGANGGTPDLRVFQASSIRKCQTFHDDCNQARTGRSTGGIITYFTGNDKTDEYREYLQVKLKKPMLKGRSYYFEMWVVKYLRGRLVSNNLGAYFSMNSFKRTSPGSLELSAMINCDSIIYSAGENWIKISDTIVMEDNARFLIIGNFTGNEKIKMDTARTKGEMYAYYLIDDVLIYDETSPPVDEPVFDEKPIEKNQEITLDHIFFETNSASLKLNSIPALDELIQFLQDYPNLRIAIHGHTDNVGKDKDNEKLSHQRAFAIEEYLIQKGIPNQRLSSKGFGAKQPISNNETVEGRAQNRRVSFQIQE